MVVMGTWRPEKIRDANPRLRRFNTSEHQRLFCDSRVPSVAETDLPRFPVELIGARSYQPCRSPEAERDAPNELRTAEADLAQAESAQRMHQPDREIDILARQRSAAAPKPKIWHGASQPVRTPRRMERRDAAVRNAEARPHCQPGGSRACRRFDTERHARELAELDAVNATEQMRDARTEVARLREEMRNRARRC